MSLSVRQKVDNFKGYLTTEMYQHGKSTYHFAVLNYLPTRYVFAF
jgi:hypothetical protein